MILTERIPRPVSLLGALYARWLAWRRTDHPEGTGAVTPAGAAFHPSPTAGTAGNEAASPLDLADVRRRDPDALGEFFDRHFDRIHSLAARLLGDRAEAEDVCQEVFLRVHRGLGTLDPERDPVPWLLTITYNTCRDYWRGRAYRSSRRSVSLDADSEVVRNLPDGGHGPEELHALRRREAAVQRALMELPEASRALLLLRDYQGLSHEEIAGVLGIGTAAARKRYSRALRQLGESLRDIEG